MKCYIAFAPIWDHAISPSQVAINVMHVEMRSFDEYKRPGLMLFFTPTVTSMFCTCARFRDFREIRGPDSSLQGIDANFSHVRPRRNLWHTLLTTIDYGQSGDASWRVCILRYRILKIVPCQGPPCHHASFEVAAVGPRREQQGS